MYYNTDRPIDSENQDLLGRSYFAKHLGRAIYDYDGKDGLVIGLFGQWGTGKTSVVNMITNHINNLSKNDDNKPLIVKFSPWRYSKDNNLISLFFQNLENEMDFSCDDEFKNKIGQALKDYSGAFDALTILPVVGPVLAPILKSVFQVQGNNLTKKTNLEGTRKKLEESLLKADKKIIVVIDDIDRLTNTQIRDAFQLVKQVADFPNIIYVLVMDREVVSRALEDIHNVDGNEYLEKIIQVSYEIPALRKNKLNEIFFNKLEQIINELPEKVIWDENHWTMVFNNCVDPYINTLRDVNRVLNNFRFRYEMLFQETSFEDMVGISTIEVLEPNLYNWVIRNKDAVCGSIKHNFGYINREKTNYRERYKNEFDKLNVNSELAIRCLSALFPVFAKDVNENLYYYGNDTDVKGKMRVAQEDKFEIYFMYDIDDIKVPRSIINSCIYNYDYTELKENLRYINNKGNIVYFINEVYPLVKDIPTDRLNKIASVLFDLLGEYKIVDSNMIFTINESDRAIFLIEDILKRIETESERYQIINDALENIDENGIGSIAQIINTIELGYGRLASTQEKADDQIVSLNHLEELEKSYACKMQQLANDETILSAYKFNIAFYLWKQFDQNGVSLYLKKMFEDNTKKLKFICSMAGRWKGNNGSGWSFNLKEYSEYATKDEIYKDIQNLDKSKLNSFTELEQIKLASFFLNYNKSEAEHVNEQTALKLVYKWKETESK